MTSRKKLKVPIKHLTLKQELSNAVARNLELHLENEKLKERNKRLISKLHQQENSQ